MAPSYCNVFNGASAGQGGNWLFRRLYVPVEPPPLNRGGLQEAWVVGGQLWVVGGGEWVVGGRVTEGAGAGRGRGSGGGGGGRSGGGGGGGVWPGWHIRARVTSRTSAPLTALGSWVEGTEGAARYAKRRAANRG